MTFARSITILAACSIIAGCATTQTSTIDQQGPNLLILADMRKDSMQRLKNVDGSSRPSNPSAIGERYKYCAIRVEGWDLDLVSRKVNESLARLGYLNPRASPTNCTYVVPSSPLLSGLSAAVPPVVVIPPGFQWMNGSARDRLSGYTKIGELNPQDVQDWRQTIIEKNTAQRLEREARRLERENRLLDFRELAKIAPQDYVTSLSIRIPDKTSPKFCTTKHQTSSFDLMSEYVTEISRFAPEMRTELTRYPKKANRQADPPRQRFDTIYNDINDLFGYLQRSEACHVLVDYPDRIQSLIDAITNGKLQLSLDVGVPVPVTTLQDSLAKKAGFTDRVTWQFGTAVGINQNAVSRFMGFGIDSAVKYKEAQASMERESYSASKQPGELLQYLADRAQAKDGESAVSVSQTRKDNEAKVLRERQEARQYELERQRAEKQRQEEERVREAKRKRDEILKNNKYMAILTCQFGNQQMQLMVCMSGPRYGMNGEIEIRSLSGYRLYQYHEVYRVPGAVNGRLEIPFNSPFSIRAQNSSSDFVLNLRIIENSTGRSIWEKSVSKLGTLNFRQ